jgi:hypothetical protein
MSAPCKQVACSNESLCRNYSRPKACCLPGFCRCTWASEGVSVSPACHQQYSSTLLAETSIQSIDSSVCNPVACRYVPVSWSCCVGPSVLMLPQVLQAMDEGCKERGVRPIIFPVSIHQAASVKHKRQLAPKGPRCQCHQTSLSLLP